MRYCMPSKGGLTALFAFILLCFIQICRGEISHDDLNIKIGQAIFEKLWVFAPSSTKSSDGLGPLYNARSCAQCHEHSNIQETELPASLVIMLSIEPDSHAAVSEMQQQAIHDSGFIPEPVYGKQIQPFAYPGAKAEAHISLTYQTLITRFPDQKAVKLRKPVYQLSAPGYGEFDNGLQISARVAPRMLGLGILDSIPDSALRALADPDDQDGDGISGRINWVWDQPSQTIKAGRFGWKAGKASLEQQNLAALANDIGISSWLFPLPQGDCSARQTECISLAESSQTMPGEAPASKLTAQRFEASTQMTDLLHAFTRVMGAKALLAQQYTPERHMLNTGERLQKGKALFQNIGCITCHTDRFNTPSGIAIFPENISAYSDLLLHDMGEALTDNRQEFRASGREWRTAPLWGIAHYLEQTATPGFLHDGRAASVLEAILWHGGEAEQSKQTFMTLSSEQRNSLTYFVESL